MAVMKRLLILTFAIVFSLICALPASAQTTAGVSGTITDDSGAAIPGVTLTITNAETNLQRETAESRSYFRARTVKLLMRRGSSIGVSRRALHSNRCVNQQLAADLELGIEGHYPFLDADAAASTGSTSVWACMQQSADFPELPNIVDASTSKLIWRAYCGDQIREMRKRDKKITAAVKKALDRFPPKEE